MTTESSADRAGCAWAVDVTVGSMPPARILSAEGGPLPGSPLGADGSGADSDDDSMPGLLTDDAPVGIPAGDCPLPPAPRMAAAIATAQRRLGEVDLAWCGTLQITAAYLGTDLLSLLTALIPVAFIVLHGAVMSLT